MPDAIYPSMSNNFQYQYTVRFVNSKRVVGYYQTFREAFYVAQLFDSAASRGFDCKVIVVTEKGEL